MTLAERVAEEAKDKDKEYIIRHAVPALEGLFAGLQEEDRKAYSQRLRTSLSNEVAGNVPDFTLIVPLVFASKHKFDTKTVMELIGTHDKASVNRPVMEAELALYSIVFDLFYGFSFENALENASTLSQESFEEKINFQNILKEMNTADLSQAQKLLFSVLDKFASSSYKHGKSYTDATALFMKGLVSMEGSEIDSEYKDSITVFIGKCIGDLR